MKTELTPQQHQAVWDRGGKLLVSAAAGSGKTKVLVDRLMGYLMDPQQPANIDDFLIITYTKAAAAELRGKIATKISEHLARQPDNRHLQRQMQRLYLAKISTVHSFCTDLLREYAFELGLTADFRVADEQECRQMRQSVMLQLLEDAYTGGMEDADFRAFVDTQGLGKDDRQVPEILLKVYDSARCHLDPEGWLDHCLESAALDRVTDVSETVWGAYLMTELRDYLALQSKAMAACRDMAAQDPGLSKVTALLEETVAALEYLRGSETWDQVVARRDIRYGVMRFPKKVEAPSLPERIKSVRDCCKKGVEKRLRIFCDPSERVLGDLDQTAGAIRGLVALVREFGRRYQALKQRRRVLDFSDLEHRTLDLLRGKSRRYPTAIAREVGARFREVLVDEYQDSNAVQDSIFSALTEQRHNCFMVGDVKQSIYQFRLADPGIFLEKYGEYLPAGEAAAGQGRKVLLSRNFRSGGAILAATNDVFRRCMSEKVGGLHYGDGEALHEGIPHEPLGEPEVELHVLNTREDAYAQEAAFVAGRIRQLLDGGHTVRGADGLRPIVAEDIVILLRSPGSVGQVFQDALAREGIASSFGNGGDLLKTDEIGVLRSLLQIISNPRQDIPLIAVLASPVFGFTADDLARIRAVDRKGDFYDAMLTCDDPKAVAFLERLAALRRAARTQSLAGLLEEIFCQTRMDSIYAAMDGGVEKQANLREFYRMAMEFEASARRDLGQFLEHLELLSEQGLSRAESAAAGAVSILSIHKSKGLEYPVVFLSALARSFNRENLRAPVLCDGTLGLGLSAVDHTTRVRYPTVAKRAIVSRSSGESLSEELRVLYVAMTRARDRLIMTYAAKSPQKELAEIGRNLDLAGTELLASEVSCPGEWVLMEAMCRREAGELFSLADARPNETHLSEHPWLIQVHEASEDAVALPVAEEKAALPLPGGMEETLASRLAFRYGHIAATQTPSKQTATQLKGRDKDQEAAEQAAVTPVNRVWRRLGDKTQGGKAYGSAMHTLMQYIDFYRCATAAGIESEIQRLISRCVLTPEQASQIDRAGIMAFFATPLGEKLLTGQILREFKFSVLVDAAEYGEGLAGEQILLQGVVDCALIEPDGITVVDFKTDYVTDETVDAVLARYRPQVRAYAAALERIYRLPVKQTCLYFFHRRALLPVD